MKKSEENIREFQALLEAGNTLEAIELGVKILNKNPANTYILDRLLDLFFRSGKEKSGINLIITLAERKFSDGYLDSAESLLKKGLKYKPDSVEMRKLLSKIYEQKGLFYEAFQITFEGWKLATTHKEKAVMKKEMILQLERLINTAEELKKRDIESLLIYFSNLARKSIGAERCSLYLYNEKTDELWTKLAHGVDKIVIPADKGFAGFTFKTGEPVISNNPYEDERFYREIDKQTGYKTKNIATVPMFDKNGKVIGVFQAINKKEGFSKDDITFLSFLAEYFATLLDENV
ncbi:MULTISPECIES: GAF domain-containing protein [unclassified Desulfurobacterium]|uniref:GAF domain-containing protein n=1 Tax=Desulfurobacterium sp. TC5-1 TaxID=1158318 RepID=UPI0003B796D9|nr:GAF domain-containing protein [Desulfurobacterium sp. TC5-1]